MEFTGGQKVKVVLAAAMWQNPHMLVLDEPTNYLDRDSLGALANAIKGFGGGVIMISHSKGKYPFLSRLNAELQGCCWLPCGGGALVCRAGSCFRCA